MNRLTRHHIALAQAPMEKAECLPFELYTNSTAHELEKRRIFHRDWVFACSEKQVENAGDYFALSIAGEPIVIIRGQDHQLRALSNVCRHRGTLLNDEGGGNTQHFVCPYHAWTYNDKGKLLGAPHDTHKEVELEQHCLPEFALEIWHGLVFISLNKNVEPLAQRFAGIERYLSLYKTDRFQSLFLGNTEHWQCNWKLAMENAMESYHLFKVHKETLETVTATKNAFYLEGNPYWTLTAGKYNHASGPMEWMMGHNNNAMDQHYILISLPPSFVGILTLESFDWISVHPDGEHNCIIRSAGLSTGGRQRKEDKQFTETFFEEDKTICERIQKSMHAQHTTGGKLIEMERIVVDFHNYLGNQISGKAVGKHRFSEENIFFNE